MHDFLATSLMPPTVSIALPAEGHIANALGVGLNSHRGPVRVEEILATKRGDCVSLLHCIECAVFVLHRLFTCIRVFSITLTGLRGGDSMSELAPGGIFMTSNVPMSLM